MRIGVLAIQGDFFQHSRMLRQLEAEPVEVRLPAHLDGLEGLILPGGESTTIGKLCNDFNLMEPLRAFAGLHPVWGTCAGAILLSKSARNHQPLLGIMDITVARNAFGRQVDSFEVDLSIPALAALPGRNTAPFHAVFIRAPLIEKTGRGVKVLAQLADGRVVAARQGRLLATSFHPELTGDTRMHALFVEIAGRR
jgi:5'-phosphate synthase pdxT subunit